MGALAIAIAVVVVGACLPQPVAVPPSTPAQTTPAPTPSATVALASPTPTATTSPTPSPSPNPSPSQGSAPPAACPSLSGGSDTAQAQITAIRTAHQPGMDRIVFEFGPSGVGTYGLPSWAISVATSFTGTSGQRVPVDGNAFQRVRFGNASTVDPTTGRQTFTQTDIRPGLPLVRQIKLIDDFERVMIWGIGLERLACATATELVGPARLVVDLPTPP
jgi:hypothetical protein